MYDLRSLYQMLIDALGPQVAVGHAAVILAPGRLLSVAEEVGARDVVMVPGHRMPRRSAGGYLTLAGIAAAVLYSWRRPNPKQKLNASDHSRQPSQWDKPIRPLEPTPQERWHPQEKQHRGWERRYWLATLILTLIIAIGAGLSARYAYQAAFEGRRQADLAEKSLVESDRPLIYIRIDSSDYGSVNDATIFISNYGIKPAIIVSSAFWNNSSGVVDYGRSLRACFSFNRDVLISEKTIKPDCKFVGEVTNPVHHLYGFVKYKSVTGAQWIQKIDYFLNLNSLEWHEGGVVDQNSEIRVNGQGDPIGAD